MKRLFLTFLLFLCAPVFAQVHSTWQFNYFTGASNGLRKVEIAPLSWGTAGNVGVTPDRIRYTNDGAGSLTVSNMATNLAYRVEFYGPFATFSVTNLFPTGTTGAVSGFDPLYLTATNISGTLAGYTIAQANSRFAVRSNAAFVGAMPTLNGTNLNTLIGSSGSGDISTASSNNIVSQITAGDAANISRNSGAGTNLNVYGTNYLGERAYIGNPANISVRPGRYSLAVGSGPTASGENALAVGSGANADGNSSVAFGLTTATGAGAFSHGDETRAEGNGSHAEGNECIALGFASHAEGNWSTAWADWTHADGDHTDARAPYSHTAGRYSQSLHVGTYVWSDNTYFIANGTNFPSSDSNQFSVFASGGIRLLGGPISGNGSSLTNLNASQLTSTVPAAQLALPFAALKSTALIVITNGAQVAGFGSVASNSTAIIPSTTLNSLSNTVAGDYLVAVNPHHATAAAGWGAILKTNGVMCGVTNMWGFQNVGSAPYPGGGCQMWHVRLPANVNCTLETRVQSATVSAWLEFRLEWKGP